MIIPGHLPTGYNEKNGLVHLWVSEKIRRMEGLLHLCVYGLSPPPSPPPTCSLSVCLFLFSLPPSFSFYLSVSLLLPLPLSLHYLAGMLPLHISKSHPPFSWLGPYSSSRSALPEQGQYTLPLLVVHGGHRLPVPRMSLFTRHILGAQARPAPHP